MFSYRILNTLLRRMIARNGYHLAVTEETLVTEKPLFELEPLPASVDMSQAVRPRYTRRIGVQFWRDGLIVPYVKSKRVD